VAGDRWEAGTAPWSESGQYTLVDPPLTTDQAASSALLSASSRESGYRHRLPLTPDLKSVCLIVRARAKRLRRRSPALRLAARA
jgi:hypothetical protein